MIYEEEQGYIPLSWEESKCIPDDTKATIALKKDNRVELYGEYMLYYHTSPTGEGLKIDYIPYSDIATYSVNDEGKVFILYTKELDRIAYFYSDNAIAETFLSQIPVELMERKAWIAHRYGESGRLLYPPKRTIKYENNRDLLLYENYIYYGETSFARVIPYTDVRAVNFDLNDPPHIWLGIVGVSSFGEEVSSFFHLKTYYVREAKRYLNVIKKRVFQTQNELAFTLNGLGMMLKKPFSKKEGEAPILAPIVFSSYVKNATILTFYEKHLTLRYYYPTYHKELRISYESILAIECQEPESGSLRRLGEILTVQTSDGTFPICSYSNAGYRQAVTLLGEKMRVYAPNATQQIL